VAKIISVYTHKGGQGKTSIAVTYALFSGSHYFTNDWRGGAETLFKGLLGTDRFHVIQEDDDEVLAREYSVFDFGGYQDERVRTMLEGSDLTLVPLCCQSRLDLDAFYNSMHSVRQITPHVMAVVNNTSPQILKAGMVEQIWNEFDGQVPVKVIKKSAYMTYLVDEGKNPLKLVDCGAQGKNIKVFQKSLIDVFSDIQNF
jgi:cellulose biosynthesis protein BcsQ